MVKIIVYNKSFSFKNLIFQFQLQSIITAFILIVLTIDIKLLKLSALFKSAVNCFRFNKSQQLV